MTYDLVIIGGGQAGCKAAKEGAAKGLRVCLVSTGLSLNATRPEMAGRPYSELYDLTRLGVTVLRGDTVNGCRWDEDRLMEVSTSNGLSLKAQDFILATGHFFSRGLIATMNRIYEPTLGADVIYPEGRENWVNPDFFAPQPFEQIGVRTTADGHIFIGGRPAKNVIAKGKILGGQADARKE